MQSAVTMAVISDHGAGHGGGPQPIHPAVHMPRLCRSITCPRLCARSDRPRPICPNVWPVMGGGGKRGRPGRPLAASGTESMLPVCFQGEDACARSCGAQSVLWCLTPPLALGARFVIRGGACERCPRASGFPACAHSLQRALHTPPGAGHRPEAKGRAMGGPRTTTARPRGATGRGAPGGGGPPAPGAASALRRARPPSPRMYPGIPRAGAAPSVRPATAQHAAPERERTRCPASGAARGRPGRRRPPPELSQLASRSRARSFFPSVCLPHRIR